MSICATAVHPGLNMFKSWKHCASGEAPNGKAWPKWHGATFTWIQKHESHEWWCVMQEEFVTRQLCQVQRDQRYQAIALHICSPWLSLFFIFWHFFEIVDCCPILSYIVLKSQDGWWKKRLASQARRPPLHSFHKFEWRNLESQVARSRSRLRGESWASYLAKISRAHHLDLNPEHVRWEDLWRIITDLWLLSWHSSYLKFSTERPGKESFAHTAVA